MKKVILYLTPQEKAAIKSIELIDGGSASLYMWIGILAVHGFMASSVIRPIVMLDGDGSYIVSYMPSVIDEEQARHDAILARITDF